MKPSEDLLTCAHLPRSKGGFVHTWGTILLSDWFDEGFHSVTFEFCPIEFVNSISLNFPI